MDTPIVTVGGYKAYSVTKKNIDFMASEVRRHRLPWCIIGNDRIIEHYGPEMFYITKNDRPFALASNDLTKILGTDDRQVNDVREGQDFIDLVDELLERVV